MKISQASAPRSLEGVVRGNYRRAWNLELGACSWEQKWRQFAFLHTRCMQERQCHFQLCIVLLWGLYCRLHVSPRSAPRDCIIIELHAADSVASLARSVDWKIAQFLNLWSTANRWLIGSSWRPSGSRGSSGGKWDHGQALVGKGFDFQQLE